VATAGGQRDFASCPAVGALLRPSEKIKAHVYLLSWQICIKMYFSHAQRSLFPAITLRTKIGGLA